MAFEETAGEDRLWFHSIIMNTLRTLFIRPILLALCVASASASTNELPVTPTQRVELFDGKSLAGWTFVSKDTNADAASIWSAKDGAIHCLGKPNGYARTLTIWQNYKLHVEWRWLEGPGNSGIFVHLNQPDKVWPLCLEMQLATGNAGDIRANGGSRVRELTAEKPGSVSRRTPGTEKPVGEWNSGDIICRSNTVTVRVNGVLQNEVTGASVAAGAIGLQAEGKPVEFRNIVLEPLP